MEQDPLGSARRQMNADACDLLDDARTELDESLADRCKLIRGEAAATFTHGNVGPR